jgi:TatA/E family protein of Tat protein translocase
MLSIPHLIIIFVVALVVFGPEKLPDLARNLGKVMAEFKRATGDLRSTFEGHLRDLEREADQRRIASSTPASAPPSESSPVPPAPGAVPTTPPHATGASADGLASQQPAPGRAEASDVSAHDSSILDTLRHEEPEQPSISEPEHNSETGSDDGHTVLLAPGAVPPTPPHATGASADGLASQQPAPGGAGASDVSAHDSSILDTLRHEEPEQPGKSEPEHNSETGSDGGHHPA